MAACGVLGSYLNSVSLSQDIEVPNSSRPISHRQTGRFSPVSEAVGHNFSSSTCGPFESSQGTTTVEVAK